ncbi:MAG: hypothetical protein ABIQ86_03705 [Steroidobacteraceae bacterium]
MPDKKKLVRSLGMILGAIFNVVFGLIFGIRLRHLPPAARKPEDAQA